MEMRIGRISRMGMGHEWVRGEVEEAVGDGMGKGLVRWLGWE